MLGERPALFTILNVRKGADGSVLKQAVTAGSPATGDDLMVESVAHFDAAGGVARLYNPSSYDDGDATTYEEIRYDGIDEDADKLLRVARAMNGTSARAWSKGSAFVQEGADTTVEKVADGKFDDEEELVTVPIPAFLYPYFRLGARDDSAAETVWTGTLTPDDDQVYVLNAPVGTVPVFDQDLEVLPPAGGGDSSTISTDPVSGKVLPPAGQGYEDGRVPASSPIPIVIGGIGNSLFVRFTTIANSSIVKYEIHLSKTNGFTPGPDTLVGTETLAGTPGMLAVFVVKDLPTGHALDASADDPPAAGTTYYVKTVAKDGSGAAPASAQASGTPIKIATVQIDNGAITEALIAAAAVTTTKIADDSVSTPKLIAGSVITSKIAAGAVTANELAANSVIAGKVAANTITSLEIAANTIVAGDIAAGTITGNEIAANTITAGKLSVSQLDAISANLGAITAGTITGVTITGGTIRTAASGSRVEISSAFLDRVRWFYSTNTTPTAELVSSSASELILYIAGSQLVKFSSSVGVELQAPLFSNSWDAKLDGLLIGTNSGAPPIGYLRLYKDTTTLKVKSPGGVVVTLATGLTN